MNGSSFDDVDRVILHHLQQNSRKPITDIAEALSVSDNTVRNRIQALQETGVQHHYLFVRTARVSRRDQLANRIRDFSKVTDVTLMTGNNNVWIIAAATEKDDVADLAYDLDELGPQIEREHLIRDHVRQPLSQFQSPVPGA